MTTQREVEEVLRHTQYVLAQVEQSRDRAHVRLAAYEPLETAVRAYVTGYRWVENGQDYSMDVLRSTLGAIDHQLDIEVAEQGAEQPTAPTVTVEWGVLFPNGTVNDHPSRNSALVEIGDYGGQLVSRSVTPWSTDEAPRT